MQSKAAEMIAKAKSKAGLKACWGWIWFARGPEVGARFLSAFVFIAVLSFPPLGLGSGGRASTILGSSASNNWFAKSKANCCKIQKQTDQVQRAKKRRHTFFEEFSLKV